MTGVFVLSIYSSSFASSFIISHANAVLKECLAIQVVLPVLFVKTTVTYNVYLMFVRMMIHIAKMLLTDPQPY